MSRLAYVPCLVEGGGGGGGGGGGDTGRPVPSSAGGGGGGLTGAGGTIIVSIIASLYPDKCADGTTSDERNTPDAEPLGRLDKPALGNVPSPVCWPADELAPGKCTDGTTSDERNTPDAEPLGRLDKPALGNDTADATAPVELYHGKCTDGTTSDEPSTPDAEPPNKLGDAAGSVPAPLDKSHIQVHSSDDTLPAAEFVSPVRSVAEPASVSNDWPIVTSDGSSKLSSCGTLAEPAADVCIDMAAEPPEFENTMTLVDGSGSGSNDGNAIDPGSVVERRQRASRREISVA